jgi:hypothetical protein
MPVALDRGTGTWNIVITASNVVLDLNGQTIIGTSNQFGILVLNASGVTIKNGGAGRGLGFAVWLSNATDCTVDNLSATTTSTSITDDGGKGNRILRCDVATVNPQLAFGIFLISCTGDLVAENLTRACRWGAISIGGGGNAFRANNINGPLGLFLSAGDSEEQNIFTGSPSGTVIGSGTHSTD